MKWLLAIVFLAGCTAVYISGDSNNVTIKDSIEGQAEIENDEEEKE